MSRLRLLAVVGTLLLHVATLAQTLPPPPDRHIADRAGILPDTAEAELTALLESFERDTSSQVVVWTERSLPPGSSLEDLVHRVFQSWKIGQRTRNNGVLLAIFPESRKMRIEVGYGLEGALPDALCGRIIANEITPHFRQGNFEAGIRAGVAGILAATRGEYRGSPGRRGNLGIRSSPRITLPSSPVLITLAIIGGVIGVLGGAWSARDGSISAVSQGFRGAFIGAIGHPAAYILGSGAGALAGVVTLIIVWLIIVTRSRGWSLGDDGYHSSWGGWSGGGGGGGGFSGGGGSSGGGGASGSW